MVPTSKKYKVLFILHLPPPVHGAAIANNYIKNSEVVNNAYETDYVSLATNTVLDQTGKGSFKKLLTFISILRNITKLLRAKEYDLCYVSLTANGPAFYKDAIVVALLKLFNRKIIYHFHNKGVSFAKQNATNEALYKFVFKNTKSILLSKYLYPDIEKYVDESDVYYCPYGIPASTITTKNINFKELDNHINLLYLSNMMIEKGVFVLLEACTILKAKNIPFKCNFVGGWTDISMEEFEDYIVEHNLKDVVVAHGPKYADEKLAFFVNSDVFIFPTFYHYETFGLVNLEAMQHSIPIISTKEGGIPDVIVDGETGFLVNKKSPQELADRIAYFASHPLETIIMGEKGKKRFDEHFTMEKFEKNISEIIKSAITNN